MLLPRFDRRNGEMYSTRRGAYGAAGRVRTGTYLSDLFVWTGLNDVSVALEEE